MRSCVAVINNRVQDQITTSTITKRDRFIHTSVGNKESELNECYLSVETTWYQPVSVSLALDINISKIPQGTVIKYSRKWLKLGKNLVIVH